MNKPLLKKLIALAAIFATTLCAETALAAEAAAGNNAAATTTIKYAGSDFLSGDIENALKENVAKAANAPALEGEMIGSKSAVTQLRAGECDFVLVMEKGDPKSLFAELAEGKWRAIPIAYLVSYVAVPRSNGVNEVSFYELRGIFARYAENHITKWENTGVKIYPILGSRTDSTANSFFQAIVFPQSPFLAQIRNTENDEGALQEASSSHEAIVVVSAPIASKFPTLKTLSVSEAQSPDEKKTAYSPTPANIYNRDYPLSVPFYVVYPVEKRAKIIPVLRAVFSNEFASTLQAQNLVPVPENIRENLKKSIDALGE